MSDARTFVYPDWLVARTRQAYGLCTDGSCPRIFGLRHVQEWCWGCALVRDRPPVDLRSPIDTSILSAPMK